MGRKRRNHVLKLKREREALALSQTSNVEPVKGPSGDFNNEPMVEPTLKEKMASKTNLEPVKEKPTAKKSTTRKSTTRKPTTRKRKSTAKKVEEKTDD